MTLPNFNSVHDGGGAREVSPTGGLREEKSVYPRFDLIPAEALERLGVHYSNGAVKYDDRNWEKGLSFVRTFNSMVGHAFKWMRCKALGIQPQEDHLAAVAWGAFALMTYEARMILVQPSMPTAPLPTVLDDIRQVQVSYVE